ncbi:MAG: hypothetical protein K0S08_984 [Gammaproteobacteria bacterium]|nr:hypothetical protein [Gammaproteobacteria bacterium]
MTACNLCGNQYDKLIEIKMGEHTYHFDCFECAIHKLAPSCNHCGCKIIGHGVEADPYYYCCAHCARQAGISGTKDRAPSLY